MTTASPAYSAAQSRWRPRRDQLESIYRRLAAAFSVARRPRRRPSRSCSLNSPGVNFLNFSSGWCNHPGRCRTLRGVSGSDGTESTWTRARDGDGAAFGALFDEHRDRVYRHALRLVESRSDAEDVMAIAFLELWRRRASVRLVDGSPLPWLLVTTSNAARNLRRGRVRYRRLLDKLERTPDDGTDAGDLVAGAPLDHLSDELASALRSLSRVDLALVTLVVWDGYSIGEAALVTGLTPAAAKARLHRARTKVRSSRLLAGTQKGALS